MSAELLRRAAETLRTTARSAIPGPWFVADDVEVYGDGGAAQVSESYSEASAALIALMHPPVALALADWLDHLAQAMGYGMPQHHAIAVARAILREPADTLTEDRYNRAAQAEAAERNAIDEAFEPPRCPHNSLDVEGCAEGGHDT